MSRLSAVRPASAHQPATTPATIPPAIREFFNQAINAFWNGIGPSARGMLRELQRSVAEARGEEARLILAEFLRELMGEIQEAQRDPDILIYGQMPASAADRLIAERSERAGVMADRVLLAHQDPQAVREITAALQVSTVGVAPSERLTAGLAALRDPGETWAVPCDLLIGGVEGLLWELAQSPGVTTMNAEGLLRDRTGRVLRSVNAALRVEVGLDLSVHVRQFLDGRFLTGEGHSVRHRRRPELYREWTAYALVALRGLLDDLGGHRLIEALATRLSTGTA